MVMEVAMLSVLLLMMLHFEEQTVDAGGLKKAIKYGPLLAGLAPLLLVHNRGHANGGGHYPPPPPRPPMPPRTITRILTVPHPVPMPVPIHHHHQVTEKHHHHKGKTKVVFVDKHEDQYHHDNHLDGHYDFW